MADHEPPRLQTQRDILSSRESTQAQMIVSPRRKDCVEIIRSREVHRIIEAGI